MNSIVTNTLRNPVDVTKHSNHGVILKVFYPSDVLKWKVALSTKIVFCLGLLYNKHILYSYSKVSILIVSRLCNTTILNMKEFTKEGSYLCFWNLTQ